MAKIQSFSVSVRDIDKRKKAGINKMTVKEFQTYQEETFDSFCKTVIRNESIDAFRELARRRDHEISFSALSSKEIASLQTDEPYNVYKKSFSVQGYMVDVCNRSLGNTLEYIPSFQRNIILLSYFLGYSDYEISKLLGISKSTVQYRRTATLIRLRKLMEDFERG